MAGRPRPQPLWCRLSHSLPSCGSCSGVKSCPTLFNPKACSTPAFPGFTVSQSFLRFTSIDSVMLPNLCRPLLLLPSIFPSIRVFSSNHN